jgi:hypothetical protein
MIMVTIAMSTEIYMKMTQEFDPSFQDCSGRQPAPRASSTTEPEPIAIHQFTISTSATDPCPFLRASAQAAHLDAWLRLVVGSELRSRFTTPK